MYFLFFFVLAPCSQQFQVQEVRVCSGLCVLAFFPDIRSKPRGAAASQQSPVHVLLKELLLPGTFIMLLQGSLVHLMTLKCHCQLSLISDQVMVQQMLHLWQMMWYVISFWAIRVYFSGWIFRWPNCCQSSSGLQCGKSVNQQPERKHWVYYQKHQPHTSECLLLLSTINSVKCELTIILIKITGKNGTY